MYRLHGFCQSGNAFKVSFLLQALGQQWEPVFVDFFKGTTRDSAWREQVNEMGEVPMLEDGAKHLTQSGAILSYLADKHGKFQGANPDEKYEVLRWLLFDNHKFTAFMATYRFLKAFGPVAPDPAVMGWLRSRMDAAFSIVNKHLAEREYMVGEAPTIADFSLSGYLFYPVEESGYVVVERFAHIGAWIERLRAIPGWASPYEMLPGERIAPKW